MKRWLMACALCLCCVVCVGFAAPAADDMDAVAVSSGDELFSSDDAGITTYSVLSPVTPDNTNGLVSVVLSVIGDYNPIVAEHRYQTSSGTWNYVREIQPDYTWLVSAAIFALVLYCVFRLWGGILCKR